MALTKEEHTRLKGLAARDGVTLAQWVRECVNDRLVEEGIEELIRLRRHWKGRRDDGAIDTSDWLLRKLEGSKGADG